MPRDGDTRNFAYVVFGEAIWTNLVQRQVVDVILGIKDKFNASNYYLVYFVPWHFYLRKYSILRSSIQHLNRHDLKCISIPIPLPFPTLSLKDGLRMRYTLGLFSIISIVIICFPILLYISVTRNIRFYHCRGYVAMLPILILKLVYPHLKVIFDPRSDFPEEHSLQQRWIRDGINIKIWKYLEYIYCKYSDKVIAIGEVFVNHYKNIYKHTNLEIIYNNVNTSVFLFDETFRNNYRNINNIINNRVICYLGSLYDNSWNDPIIYAKFIKKYIQDVDSRGMFLFLIPSDCRVSLENNLYKHGVTNNNFIIEHPGYAEVPKYLSIADIGMYFLPYYSPRVGTKFVEYCSMGIPIIVNNNVGGAVHLIKNYELGLVIKDELLENYHIIGMEAQWFENILEKKDEYFNRARKYAVDNFDNNIVINKYKLIYDAYNDI